MTDLADQKIIFSHTIKYYITKFYSELKIVPILGCELEFYARDNVTLEKLKNTAHTSVIQEEGVNQFELLFSPTLRPLELLNSINSSKEKLKDLALFNAKPFEDQPSSSLHIHINFLNEDGDNIFEKNKGQNTDVFLYSLGGLLHFMKESCVFFAPQPEDYKRYTIESMHTPSNISWGINNRTTALRITPMEKGPRRIEHRLSSSSTPPDAAIALILMSIYIGIRDKIMPPPPTYGIAFDPQYSLEKLPQTLEEAQILMINSGISSTLLNAIKENQDL